MPELRELIEETRQGEQEIVLNMGPQHPSTHGVLRVVAKLVGETVVEAIPDIGYLHRGAEKLAEGMTYPQWLPITDRLDYVSSMANEIVYVTAVEKLLQVEIPERAKYIRVIMAELQRIASHLIWWGTFALDLGAVTPFTYAMREREKILDLFELTTGARLTYSYMRIGGVRNDLPEGFIPKCREFCDLMEKRLAEYDDLLTGSTILEARLKGVGVIPPEMAIAYGASGPVLRGSGVPWDLRKVQPYFAYDKMDFNVPVGKNGDVLDRYMVRVAEMKESIKIVRQALDGLPDGETMAKVPRVIKPPVGEAMSMCESPRGTTGCYIVSDGSDKPLRTHWRAPSFIHLQLIPALAPGFKLADLVAIVGSIDIVLGEVDR